MSQPNQRQPSIEEQLYIAYQQLQLLEEQSKTLIQQYETFNQLLNELQATKTTLEAIKDLDTENEILIPIGGSVFLKGKLIDTQETLQFIGASVYMPKSREDALKKTNERMDQVRDAISKTNQDLNKLHAQMDQLKGIIQTLTQAQKQ